MKGKFSLLKYHHFDPTSTAARWLRKECIEESEEGRPLVYIGSRQGLVRGGQGAHQG